MPRKKTGKIAPISNKTVSIQPAGISHKKDKHKSIATLLMLYKLWKPHCHFTELSLKFMKKASVQQLPTKKRLYTKFIKARRHDMTSFWLPTVRFLNTLPSHFSRPKNCDTRFHKVFIRSRSLVSFCLNDFLSVLFVSVSKSLISSKSWTCSYKRGSPSKGSESNASIKWKLQHLPGYTPGHSNF